MAFIEGLGEYPSIPNGGNIPRVTLQEWYEGLRGQKRGRHPAPQRNYITNAQPNRIMALWGVEGACCNGIGSSVQVATQRLRGPKGQMPIPTPHQLTYHADFVALKETPAIRKVVDLTRESGVLQNAIETQANRLKQADTPMMKAGLDLSIRRLIGTKKRVDDVRQYMATEVKKDPVIRERILDDPDMHERIITDPSYESFQDMIVQNVYLDPFVEAYYGV